MSVEEAEDSTQEFLARAIERGTFDSYDPEKARFRTFVRVCLDRWIVNQRQSAARLKRGGGTTEVALEAVEPSSEAGDPEEIFHREWLRTLFETALEELRRECSAPERGARWTVFERCELGDPTGGRPSYAELAGDLSLPVTTITNHLAWCRRELRRLVLDELRRQTASDREFRDEARRALGSDPA
jgi:RNA polymerase sigma factor (sigma-70 family)